jgi:uncharacterized protein (DUF1015 family)
MVDFRAFQALRPPTARAAEVACVPYDVVNTQEARALAAQRPGSLLHVTRPDIDLPDGADMYAPAVYAQAKAAFDALIEDGALVRDDRPGFFVYAQTMGDHRQVGIVGVASATDYAEGRIKKHEFTRPDKEDDRTRHVEAVGAHLGPVFVAFKAVERIDALIAQVTSGSAEVDFIAEDGIRHTVWPVFDAALIEGIEQAFATEVPALYIADGHHRTAAAARVGQGAAPGDPRGRFLTVAFPDTALKILPYNRVVHDLNGRTPTQLLDALEVDWDLEPLPDARAPGEPLQVSMYLDEQWYQLTLKADKRPDPTDPVARLDVSVVQDRVLGPLLNIADPRTAKNISFVGGIRGLGALQDAVDANGGVAFALYPTSLQDLMDIADAGEVMPPKSTWFEPKLRSGLVISTF